MKKSRLIYLFALATVLSLASCSRLDSGLEADQSSLMGTSVQFRPYFADEYQSKTYIFSGDFNDLDRMVIYREYWDRDNSEFISGQTFRAYQLLMEAKLGWNPEADIQGKEDAAYFVQTPADSLTWDNDKTVRFRSMNRSNMAYCICDNNARYYPDYSISEWKTASGPTFDVPLELRHLPCRIVVSDINNGNRVVGVELSFDPADYARDGLDIETATQRAANVEAVYNRMCMPSGVDVPAGRLYAMPKSYYENNTLEDVEMEYHAAAHVDFGTYSPTEIKEQIMRPCFNNVAEDDWYFLTIPYDFSSEVSTQGDLLVLPPYTRFRIHLYDVNDGDIYRTPGTEGTYHLLALEKILKEDSTPKYPDGLIMKAGYSYWFKVGYRYDELQVETLDFSWNRQDMENRKGNPEIAPVPESEYAWWVREMNSAAKKALSTNNYNPSFSIANEAQFLSFVKLVNGTASSRVEGELTSAYTRIEGERHHGWYSSIIDKDTIWVRIDSTNMPGYDLSDFIFYDHYYPQDGDVKAYVVEDYVFKPYVFFDANLNKHYNITLNADLDLKDWKFSSIGSGSTAFGGYFDGGMHTVKHLYSPDGYMFLNIKDAAVKNLIVTTFHNTTLVASAEGTNYFLGISMIADSQNASIVDQVSGEAYLVGCSHIGRSGKGLVKYSDSKLLIYGCMQIAPDLVGGAFCDEDIKESLAPQHAEDDNPKGVKIAWGQFIGNYYDVLIAPYSTAVTGIPDAYKPQEYIRGVSSHIIKSPYNLPLPTDRKYDDLDAQEKVEYYGNAPWRAMNSAIYYFNNNISTKHICSGHYVVGGPLGYDNRYPSFIAGVPTDKIDLTTEPN